MSQSGPANYTANVNRAKTKKWVEAKSYSYDGDDWGDVDDYDEYGGYDEPGPEPAPAPKPTGLRQRGQSATQVPQETYNTRQDVYQSPVESRQPYANTSSPLVQQQQQQLGEGQNVDIPQTQQQPAMMRPKSFDREDEKRAFSTGGPQRDSPSQNNNTTLPHGNNIAKQDFQSGQQPQNRSVPAPSGPARPPISVPGRRSMEGQARYGEHTQSPGGTYRGGSNFDQTRQPVMGSRAQSMTSSNSAMEFQSRRDFSPSAIPPPLQMRGSPSPHRPDSNNSSRPPRKSSLGQGGAPSQSQAGEVSLAPAKVDEEEPSSTRERAGSSASKPLPFVRPAEIYRRMQEEKEKERQSQESSRPSMDTILGSPSDRPNLGRSQPSESSLQVKPTLDPVKERRSEYGLEGVHLQDEETPGERRSTSSKTFEFPKRSSKASSHAPKSSLGPMLPDVSRVSGFGESFFGTTDVPSETSQEPMQRFAEPSLSQPTAESTEKTPERDLQHQPSLGFTSAVHQAFDKAEDQVPPTPSSTQGSSVGRSTSGGTSTVSPIISRGPSTATENWNSRLPGIDNVATPMIPEGPEGGSPRPISSGSLGTPTQIVRKPSPIQNNPPSETEKLPPSFIPGYRRNSDTPSPDNSPRRTPALEINRQLRQPQEVEIAAATPTEPSHSTGSSSQVSDISSEEKFREDQPRRGLPDDSNNATASLQGPSGRFGGVVDPTISPISPSHDRLRERTDSSGSNRVRNLADKFESGSRPGSAHSTTPRASVLGGNPQRKDEPISSRPLADRMESFRPQLPGGWESSASIAPVTGVSARSAAPVPRISENAKGAGEHDVPDQQPTAIAQVKDASEEAFAAVAAAGSALAGAFGAAVGVEGHDDPSQASGNETPHIERTLQERHRGDDPSVRSHGALHPEAFRPQMPILSDDETSTAAPTPLPKDVPTGSTVPSNGSDYFPPSAPHDSERSAGSVNKAEPIKQTPALPPLSTDTRPQYESDRLRKEIVRELTPMSASEPTTAETDYSNYQPTLSTNPSIGHPGRESGVLPKEYESYWNDASSDAEADDSNASPNSVEGTAIGVHHNAGTIEVPPLQPNQARERTLSATSPQEESSPKRSPMLPHRFSWEQPLQELPTQSKPASDLDSASESLANPPSNFLKNSIYPEGHFQAPSDHPEIAQSPSSPKQPEQKPDASYRAPVDETPIPLSSNRDNLDQFTENAESHKELLNSPTGLEPVSSPAYEHSLKSPTAEKTNDYHQLGDQSSGPQFYQKQEPDPPRPGPPRPESLVQTGTDVASRSFDNPQVLPTANAPVKTPAFREMLALKSPIERISAYNDTREQFANLNTGLAHWLASTLDELPEHSDLFANAGRVAANFPGHKPSPSRSKLGGLLPGGGPPSQQPYYQQYLNASSSTAGPDGKAVGGGMGGASSQGMPSSGGSSSKLSSQQVQAKGKDLLHSAGMFGGKANVAAKGLFSKGKSKLRAASGNEKV